MTDTRFRQLLIAYVVLLAGSIIAPYFPDLLSPTLAEAYANEPEPRVLQNLWIAAALAVIVLGVFVASLVGLYGFQRWGRSIALWSTLVGMPLLVFMGPAVYNPLENALYETSAMAWGAILALAYWSPVSARFARDAAPRASAADGHETLA